MTLISIVEEETETQAEELKDKHLTLKVDYYKDILEDGEYISTVVTFSLYRSHEDFKYDGLEEEFPFEFKIEINNTSTREKIHKAIKRNVAKILLELP